jgi:type IV secretory pathway TrbD component
MMFNSSKNIAFSTLIFPQQTWTELPDGGILILKLPHWLLRKSARCDSRMQGVNAKLSPEQELPPLARA